MNFESFGFHSTVAAGVVGAGFKKPTPIQEKAIPQILSRCDVMGLAQTGTGKTAAFVLPILNSLTESKQRGVRALIMAPTRELAEQIHQDVKTLGRKTHITSVSIYGGVGINPQIQKLKHSNIVIACPGRLLDHIRRNTVDLSHLDVLVIDEADEMFDMGFLPDIRQIIKRIPKKRQTLLFSATMPAEISRLAKDILRDPSTVKVGDTQPAETVNHALFPVAQHQKTALLLELLENTQTKSVLVFTRTKHRAKNLGKKLMAEGYRSTSLQGNLSQARRKAALDGFRNGSFKILVATDIAARGIDVTRISHVINYDMPSTTDAYVHRIGRTGRATRNGEAYTFITQDDKQMVRAINRIVGIDIEQRTLASFNYDAPTENRRDQPLRFGKAQQKAFRMRRRQNKNKSRLN